MKKRSILLTVLALSCALAACGEKEEAATKTETTTEATTETTETKESSESKTEEQPAETAGEVEEEGQNPVMNLVGTYAAGRASIEVTPSGKDGAEFLIYWGSSAFETSMWTMSGTLDMETLEVSYTDGVRTNIVFDENNTETDTVVYENGTGCFTFNEDGTLTWADDMENCADGMEFEYVSATSDMELANPWKDVTEEEALTYLPVLFRAPKDAEEVCWSVMESGSDVIVQVDYFLGDCYCTARASRVADAQSVADIAGIFTEWDVEEEVSLNGWNMDGTVCRSFGETDTMDLISWYDEAEGMGYTLLVTAADLDGFDVQALAESMYAGE